ncbi:N-acetylmuramoyl-L-alanine amidase [Rubrobacter calidifluminis]|uniref:N-acetylmuramoyl-L-alanine amidase n=1 Tax=Rubrobacter calidifluminis TaxID=1392640 RepID=UPI002361DC57|nr:N-acetylmuramoyl-L-alanine amidase [Rubrobacter calidifluminis]
MQVLRRGDRGREVVDLQTRLNALGYDLGNRGIDGVFREETELAVKSFQREVGIEADGVVGRLTWRELVEAGYRPGSRLLYLRQPPLRGADVAELQRMLNDLGFDPGAVNGLFDQRTARAVLDFQRNAGLEVDGVVDEAVFRVLRVYASQTLGTYQIPDKNDGYFPDDLFDGVIVVDAAHGGEDAGYVCPDGFSEAELNLAVARELARILPAREVILTRSEDVYVSPEDRAYLANSSGAKMVLSIHHAHHRTPSARGTATFYFERMGYRSHRGRMAATYVQRGICRALGTCDIGEFGRSYDILRETNIPAVMVEPLFLTNPGELEMARDPSYPETLARAMTEALELYASRDRKFIAV